VTHAGTVPNREGDLDVGDGQHVYWQEWGNPAGAPILYVHGGPGGNLGNGGYRKRFDLERTRLIGFEQRGCGRSTPSAADPKTSLAANTTAHLVADMDAIRTHLAVDRWGLSGGSWGSTLALAYATTHPERVTEVVLAAVTTTSRAEVNWITEGVGMVYPEAWDRFAAYAERAGIGYRRGHGRLVQAYASLINSPSEYWESVEAHMRNARPEFHNVPLDDGGAFENYQSRLRGAVAEHLDAWWFCLHRLGAQGRFGELGKKIGWEIWPRDARCRTWWTSTISTTTRSPRPVGRSPVCDHGAMGLRSPIYLDSETLLVAAEYHGVDFPRAEEIVEKSVRNREGSAKIGYRAVSAGGSAGSNVEFQATYSLEPREKATTSKVIDGFFNAQVIKTAASEDQLWKDDLVEVDGELRVTAASMVGKMFYLLRTLLEGEGVSIEGMEDLDFESPAVQDQFKDLYLRNALPPIPLLVKVSGPPHQRSMYANLDPGRFVGAAALDLLEGPHRVLGTVRQVVPGGNDGYLATDPWLLSGWEHLFRRLLMTQIADQVQAMTKELDILLPEDDAYGWIKGPAVVLDAIAIY